MPARNSYLRWRGFLAVISRSAVEVKGRSWPSREYKHTPSAGLNRPNLPSQLGRCPVAFRKLSQLPLGNNKFREATIQTREKHWKNPDDGLVQTFKSWEMNSDFSVEIALVGLA